MTQQLPPFLNRRLFLTGASGLVLGLSACSRENAEAPERKGKTFKMGERAAVGLLTYNILEATYFTQLGAAGAYKMPDKRFLVIRLAITNGGAKEAELPFLRLVDDAGTEYSEVGDADFLPGWFGLIRKIGPTQTEEGRILFDVQPKSYLLEVTDGAEPSKEQLGFVEIPIDFDTAEPVPSAR
jgi:hypothetical protein